MEQLSQAVQDTEQVEIDIMTSLYMPSGNHDRTKLRLMKNEQLYPILLKTS